MLYTDSLTLHSVCENAKKNLTYILKIGRFIGACFWDACLLFVFGVASGILCYFAGPSITTYVLMGLLYIVTLGRRGLFSGHGVFSLAMLPCLIPSFLFCIVRLPGFESNTWSLIFAVIWIALSRLPLCVASSQHQTSRRNVIKKILFFIALQGIYGVGFQIACPSLFEPLESMVIEVPIYPMTPKHRYPSATAIQFFYDDLQEAEKIEAHLPEVLEALKSSPFYQNAEDLVLVQKPRYQKFADDQKTYGGGCFHPLEQYSYYFSEVNNAPIFLNDIYYSHKNPYRAIVLHELAHQMVSRYYGKWWTVLSVVSWKNEGYAEYMAATGCYRTKAELLAIITESSLSDRKLEGPFSGAQSSDGYGRSDYIAAFLQTRYALDEKKISPLEFFKSSYQLASAQEIRNWLRQEDRL